MIVRMLFPSRQDRTDNPFTGLTDKQQRVFVARVVDQESYGRIALREGVRCRKSILSIFRRAIANIRRNGWDLEAPFSLAA